MATAVFLFDTMSGKANARTPCWVGLYPGSTVNSGYDRICENINPTGEFMGEGDCSRLIGERHGEQNNPNYGGKQWEMFWNISDIACQEWINACPKCDPNGKK